MVSIGTLNSVSGVGTSETHRALVTGNANFIGFAALDAGLVEVDAERSTAERPRFLSLSAEDAGAELSLSAIEARWGKRLRASMGIRELSKEGLAPHSFADIAAPLPHDLEYGGLRRISGLTFGEIRHSAFADMFGLFDDDPRLGPSLQAQLFLYGGLGALAALPAPLSTLLEPRGFRVAAGCAFPGLDSLDALTLGMQPRQEPGPDRAIDKLAYRLSASLGTHGPALLSAMLSPSFNLSKVKRHPALLENLLSDGPLRRVPQAPLVSSAACASALIGLCEIAVQLVGVCPGVRNPALVLLTAADAALRPDGRVLEGFGNGALMTRQKLDALNAGRAADEQRSVAESLCPFDVDAQGTVVGHAGSGLVITTLDFALRNFLDVTSLVVGWGQSNETGGKGHFAGVGFGGENAMILALLMAGEVHGYGIEQFGHLVAHATGTRTNSRTDLVAATEAREAVRRAQGFAGRLPEMSVSAPKSIGDGHSMGETGLKAIGEGIQYLLGQPAVGIPTLRRLDDQLARLVEDFRFSAAPVPGDADGGAVVSTQGFGGYDGAVALRAAHADAMRRYAIEPRVLDAYLERWPEIRSQRVEREAQARRRRGAIRELAETHCWPMHR